MKNALTKPDDRIRRINALHVEVEKTVGEISWLKDMAVAIAAKLGAELIALKGEVPHGQFEIQIENSCAFSIRKAQLYMKLAEELQARFPKTKSILLLTGEVADIAPKLNKLIEGQTLTQLMFDWKILKKKVKKHAAPTEHPDDDSPRDSAVRATGQWLEEVESLLSMTDAHQRNFDKIMLDRFNRVCEQALKTVNPARKF